MVTGRVSHILASTWNRWHAIDVHNLTRSSGMNETVKEAHAPLPYRPLFFLMVEGVTISTFLKALKKAISLEDPTESAISRMLMPVVSMRFLALAILRPWMHLATPIP